LTQATDCRGKQVAILRFKEGFPHAFKLRAVALDNSGKSVSRSFGDNDVTLSESSVRNAAASNGAGKLFVCGLASFGTRFRVTFNNVPADVRVFVSCNSRQHPLNSVEAVLTASETDSFSELDRTDVIGKEPVVELSFLNGSATAVWELTKRTGDDTQTMEFGVFVKFTAEPLRNSPALGTASVNGVIHLQAP
jgi:hypothetical protein